jgi:hypothetical protein
LNNDVIDTNGFQNIFHLEARLEICSA